MLIGFIIGGFIFFTLVVYFVVLILFPEWVGVSGRNHQEFLKQQRGDEPNVGTEKEEREKEERDEVGERA